MGYVVGGDWQQESDHAIGILLVDTVEETETGITISYGQTIQNGIGEEIAAKLIKISLSSYAK